MRTGSPTGWHLPSHWKRVGDIEVKIATKSLVGFSVGSLGAQGEFLELRVGLNPEQVPGKKEIGEKRRSLCRASSSPSLSGLLPGQC